MTIVLQSAVLLIDRHAWKQKFLRDVAPVITLPVYQISQPVSLASEIYTRLCSFRKRYRVERVDKL